MDTTPDNQTKKQQREQMLADSLKQQKQQERQQLLKRIGIWTGAVVVLGFMVWGLAKLAATSSSVTTAGDLVTPVSASDWTLGNASSTVTVVEYGDFQCPYCAAFDPTVKQILNQYSGKVLFVYRDFPLLSIHRNSGQADRAAYAATAQGAFWPMHDLLFQNQNDWADANDPEDLFVSYAKQLGLDLLRFKTDMDSAAAQAKVTADETGANNNGINATPTFFVNGKQLTSYANLGSAIASALK